MTESITPEDNLSHVTTSATFPEGPGVTTTQLPFVNICGPDKLFLEDFGPSCDVA